MNKAYRLIWSSAKNAWVIAAEIVRGKGLPAVLSVAAVALMGGHGSVAHALPSSPVVVNGQAAFSTSGNTLTVTNSDRTVINWNSFNISSGEVTKFIQPTSLSSVLNRVTSSIPSAIYGTLQSNGKVFLVNQNGIFIGPDAKIDTQSFIASTLNIQDSDFIAGRLRFNAGPLVGKIENQGTIRTPNGGSIYLIAPDISNSGIINAPNGDILLAAGHQVNLIDSSDPELAVVVSAPEHQALNLGQIIAEAGRIGISGGLVKQRGTVSASSAVSKGGRIFFKATRAIDLAAGSVTSADGTTGGAIIAKTEENGQISGTLTAQGTLTAKGDGSKGSGGFVETSAQMVDLNGISVNTSGGTWLIDPFDFTIASTGGDITGSDLSTLLGSNSVVISTTTGTNSTTNLYSSTIGNGDIFVNDAVNWGASTKLTLSADRNIAINRPITATGTSLNTDSSTQRLVLAFNQGGGGGDYSIAAPISLPSGQTFSTLNGTIGTDFTVITSLGSKGDEALANTFSLQGIAHAGNLSGSYALGANIDATATSSWNSNTGFTPVGSSTSAFTGIFEGLGHSVTGLTINRPTMDYVGLFGFTGSLAKINNIRLNGATVTGNSYVGSLVGNNSGQIHDAASADAVVTGYGEVGGLAGISAGGIDNSSASGNVTTASSGYHFGGLAGQLTNSTISNSHADVTVYAPSGSSVGGLAGENNGGVIAKSYATGHVTGNIDTGGLVGWNQGAVTNSYAIGSVTATNQVGGLVGNNTSTGSITTSYSSGLVTGTSSAGGLIGYNMAPAELVTSSYWDAVTSGLAVSDGGSPISTATAQLSYTNFDFTNTWWMIDGNTRPFLRSEWSPTIRNAHQLQLMGMNLSAAYTLANDIDMSELTRASGMWDTTKGFMPVGNTATPFSGIVNGAGHTIANLIINRPTTTEPLGLLGVTDGLMKNLGLSGGSVTGGMTHIVGGLAGTNLGTISNSYSSSTVSGNDDVGGLVGYNNNGTISNSYFTGKVTGNSYVGGLVGWNSGTISNSYSSGSVSGTGVVGGLVGTHDIGSITDSFWDKTINSALTDNGFGVGKNTLELMSASTYSAWTDFASNWWMSEGNTRPFLRSEWSPTIRNAHQLQLMGMNLSATYTLANDIDMSELAKTSGMWNTATGFVPVGDSTIKFTGTFDGLGHTISGLSINRPTAADIGLFGSTNGSTISNIGLLHTNVTGAYRVGSLVGSNAGTITNSYATGSVTGTTALIGGLIGEHSGTASNSYADVSVAYASTAPGVGGLVGQNWGTISNSYAIGSVDGGGSESVGGLVGVDKGIISSSYSTGAVIGTGANVGGLVGWSNNNVTNSYWDKDTSGRMISAAGTGLTTAEFMQSTKLTGFDFTNTWWMSEGNTRPFLRSEWNPTIRNAHQLQLMGMNLSATYTLANDIDMSELAKTSGMWDVSKGFVPVGSLEMPFTGTFEGLGHTISGLAINRPTTDYVGLFGFTDNSSIITDLGLSSVNITGQYHVGGMAGQNRGLIINSYSSGIESGTAGVGGLVGVNNLGGSIRNSYSSGSVTGTSTDNGGLVGTNIGNGFTSNITNSYSTSSVNSPGNSGGLVGNNYTGGLIENSYSTGSVTGSGTSSGGLVGFNFGTVTNSFWDVTTSGLSSSVGGIGLTTAEMMTAANFTSATQANGNSTPNWNIPSTWGIIEGISYPYLKWQFSGTPQIISGTFDVSAGGRAVQTAASGRLLSHSLTGANGFFYQALPGNSLPDGAVLLAYLSNDANYKSTTVTRSSGSHLTGLTLTPGTVTATNLGDINSTAFSGAKGSLSSADILFSAGSNLNIDGNFKIKDTGSVTQSIPFSANSLELLTSSVVDLSNSANSISTLAGNVGTLHLTNNRADWAIGTVGASIGLNATNNVTLNSTGAVSQSAPITAGSLELLGSGSFTLTYPANRISTIAGYTTGQMKIALDTPSTTIGTVNSTSGLTSTAGGINVTNTGKIQANKNISAPDTGSGSVWLDGTILELGPDTQVTAGGSINLNASDSITTSAGSSLSSTAGSLMLSALGSGGTITTAADYTVSDLGAITLQSSGALTINGGNFTGGGNAITLESGWFSGSGSISIAAPVTAINGPLLLNAKAGDITQTSTGVISAQELSIRTNGGNVQLGNAANQLESIAGSTNGGSFSFTNAPQIKVGAIAGGEKGISSTNNDGFGKAITLVSTTAGVIQTEPVIAGNGHLSIIANGPVVLDQLNQSGSISASVTGTGAGFTYQDSGTITIAGSGITVTGDVSLTAGNITQASGSIITAPSLQLTAGSNVNLTEANPVGVVAGSFGGTAFNYKSANQLTIANLGSHAGINASGRGDITLESPVGINQQTGTAILTSGGLKLVSNGQVDLSSSNNAVSTLAANAASFSYGNSTDLTIGTVDALSGVTSIAQTVIKSAGLLDVTAPVNSSTSDVMLGGSSITTRSETNESGTTHGNISGSKVMLSANTTGGTLTIDTGITATSAIGIKADNLSMTGGALDAATGQIVITPATDGRPKTIGEASCLGGTSTCLLIPVADTTTFNALSLVIGNDDKGPTTNPGYPYPLAGDIHIGNIDRTSSGNLTLLSGGSITQSSDAVITANSLAVSAVSGPVALNTGAAPHNISVISGKSNGDFSISAAGPLTVGSLISGAPAVTRSGISANGAVTISSSSDLTLSAPVTGTAGVALQSGGTTTISGTSVTSAGATEINSSGDIVLDAARIESAGDQIITTPGSLTLRAGASGSDNGASIRALGSQAFTIGGSLTLTGGGSTGSSNNSAEIVHGTDQTGLQQPVSGVQSFTFTGSGAKLTMTGGSGDGTSGYYDSVCGTTCQGYSSGNRAGIRNLFGEQTFDFQQGGSISLSGGNGGNGNQASIDNEAKSLQLISNASGGTPPSIILTGGSGGVILAGSGANYTIENSANISSRGSQTIVADSISMTGGTGAASRAGAYLGAPSTSITATSLSMKGGDGVINSLTSPNGATYSGTYMFASPAAIGAGSATDITLNIGSGGFTATGGANGAYGGSAVLIGAESGTPVINISVDGAATLSGPANSVRFGTIQSTGGTLDFSASGDLNLNTALTLPAGHNLTAGGALNGQNGSLSLSGGSLTLNNATTLNDLTISGGLVGGTGALSVTDSFVGTGGSITGISDISLHQTAGSLALGTPFSVTGTIMLNANSDIILSAPLTADGDITAITAGRFTNSYGSGALTSSTGRWLVWSADPAQDTRGGLGYSFKQYNATYGTTTPAGIGNGFLYSLAPTLTTALTGNVTRVYDGTTIATLTDSNYSTSGIDGDAITLANHLSGVFDTKDVGSGKQVTVSGLTASAISSATDGSVPVYGYSFSPTVTGTIGTITPKALTVSGTTASGKTYDGTTAATITVGAISGLIGSETVNTTAAGNFDSKNAGSRIASATYALADGTGGGLAANYTLADTTGLAASITPKALTVSGTTASGKTYDGTTAATITVGTIAGFVGSETVNATAAGNFDSKNAGSRIASATYALADGANGGLAANYTLADSTGLAASITPKALTVSGTTASGKTYDGTTAATITVGTIAGFVGSETVNATAAGNFDSKNAGSRIASATYALADGANGGLAANYTLADSTGLTASITPKALTVSGTTASGKTYDGTTAATITVGAISGLIGSETVNATVAGSFDSKNAGSRIASATYALADGTGGGLAANYTLADTTGLTASITPKALTVSGTTAPGKTYDGTTAAAITMGTIAGFVGSETVNATAAGSFDSKNAGSRIASATYALADGTGGGLAANYTLADSTGLTASITPKALTVSGTTAASRMYDGTTATTVSGGTVTPIGSDSVTVLQSGSFSDKNVGSGKTVTYTSSLTGPDAGNYVLDVPSATTTANITIRDTSTWNGSRSNLWSDPANWDALPDLSNVRAVVIPAGASQVVYDTSAGATTLESVTSSRGISLTGGNLTVANNLTTTGYQQSGGAVNGTGSMTVSDSFSQTGGTISLTGTAIASLTQKSGDLNVANISAPTINLSAPAGAITQSGPLSAAARLATLSATGTTLTDTGNKFAAYAGTNSTTGDITLTNGIPVTIEGMENAGGGFSIDNTGGITTVTSQLKAAGNLVMVAHSPLTIGSGGLSATGDITLEASPTASGSTSDVLTIAGPVAAGGNVTFKAGSSLVENATVTAGGTITKVENLNTSPSCSGGMTWNGGACVAAASQPVENPLITTIDTTMATEPVATITTDTTAPLAGGKSTELPATPQSAPPTQTEQASPTTTVTENPVPTPGSGNQTASGTAPATDSPSTADTTSGTSQQQSTGNQQEGNEGTKETRQDDKKEEKKEDRKDDKKGKKEQEKPEKKEETKPKKNYCN